MSVIYIQEQLTYKIGGIRTKVLSLLRYYFLHLLLQKNIFKIYLSP